MILPTKHIPAEQSFIGVGAALLQYIERPKTISNLWDQVRDIPVIGTFERFIIAMDMLFILGLINFNCGKVQKVQP
jgi:hypothetical protein